MSIMAKLSFPIKAEFQYSIRDALDKFKTTQDYVDKLKTRITSESMPSDQEALSTFLYDNIAHIWLYVLHLEFIAWFNILAVHVQWWLQPYLPEICTSAFKLCQYLFSVYLCVPMNSHMLTWTSITMVHCCDWNTTLCLWMTHISHGFVAQPGSVIMSVCPFLCPIGFYSFLTSRDSLGPCRVRAWLIASAKLQKIWCGLVAWYQLSR